MGEETDLAGTSEIDAAEGPQLQSQWYPNM